MTACAAETSGLSFRYGDREVLRNVSLGIAAGQVTALIGPSGCGKSTFLRTFNRMNDGIPGARVSGTVTVGGEDVNAPSADVTALRRRVGMVFQKSNPFPRSVRENVAFGLKLHGERRRSVIEETVERCLRKADLWDEVSGRLAKPAAELSGGQQQRLCIARALAVNPSVLLMDEPASALDPRSTAKIEELIGQLRGEMTVVIVTHNMQQAARVSDRTAFFYEGELVEQGPTDVMFTNPVSRRTEDYVRGRFG